MPTIHDSPEGQTQHMTDTQEAMREEFEAYAELHPDYSPLWLYPENHLWEFWQAATAQSAEKIARLEAEKKDALLQCGKTIDRMAAEITDLAYKLAAAKLSNKQYRDSLDKIDALRNDIIARQAIGWSSHVYPLVAILDAALAQQPSTKALDACVAAHLAAAIPEGLKLVPIDLTDAMQVAGGRAVRFDTTVINKLWTANRVWRAVVAAAPLPPSPGKQGEE